MAPGTPPGTPPGLGRAKLARQTDMPDKFVLQNGKCRAKTHPACDTAAQTHEFARHFPFCATTLSRKSKLSRKNDHACDNRAQSTTNATKSLRVGKTCAANDELSRGRQTIPRKPNKAATDSWHTRTYQPSTRRNAATTSMRAKSPSVAPIHQSISSVWTKTCGKPTFSLEWRDHCASKWR